MIEGCVGAGLREPEFETAGQFVIRIRRAVLAGQPVVFTNRNDARSRTKEKAESQLEVGTARVGTARVGTARVETGVVEDQSARILGWRPPVESGAVQPFGTDRHPASSTQWSAGSWPTG